MQREHQDDDDPFSEVSVHTGDGFEPEIVVVLLITQRS